MTDQRDGFFAAIMKSFLSIVSFFYDIAVRITRFIATLKAQALPCKVISVGNLTMGGTGKTPAACMLAKRLKGAGRRPTVLIRGYGDDEWRMLKELLGDIPVIVGRDRLASGKTALSKFNADTIILDDGFQHWRLRRDLDIVLVDSTNPFGNGRLFPRGLLRECTEALRRADMVMLTKTDMARKDLKGVKDKLKKIAPDIPVLESVHKPLGFYLLMSKERLGLDIAKGRRICALSSIENTGYFEHTLKTLGADVAAGFHYPDHYNYKDADLKFVTDECKKQNIDTIVTTEKDAVKLRWTMDDGRWTKNGIRVLVLQVELKVTGEEEALDRRLHSLYSR